MRELAAAHVERGEARLQSNEIEGAWQDLLQAEQLPEGIVKADRLREALGNRGVAKVRALLDLAEPTQALEAVTRLRDRAVSSPELMILGEVARDWLRARDHAQQGEFREARERVHHIRGLATQPIPSLDDLTKELQRQEESIAVPLERLHQAAEQGRWREVVDLSEEILRVAPRHAEVRQLRSQAWNELQPTTVVLSQQTTASIVPPAHLEAGQRLLLWIDGIGGFLVCLGNRVTLGQAATDSWVDVPIFADVSRLHAVVTRDKSSYILDALRPVQVNNQATEKSLLRSGDRVTLGASCQVHFRQPVPVSSTARLDVVSGHRLPWAVDAVLLMADTLVIGPGAQSHIAMPDLAEPLVIFRQKESLGVRHAGEWRVDGQLCKGRALLGPAARIVGDDFVFAIEPVEQGRRGV